jgi:heme/copper-type cytochrome/quinol oxidase subunit 2
MKPPTVRTFAGLLICAAICLAARMAPADDAPAAELKLANGRFDPPEVVVPANKPFTLRVTNAGDTVSEFESFELHRERVVQPGETITVYLPALDPGKYPFFDDFHHDTPEGAIVAQ